MLFMLLGMEGLVKETVTGDWQEDRSRLGTPPELLAVTGASLKDLKH